MKNKKFKIKKASKEWAKQPWTKAQLDLYYDLPDESYGHKAMVLNNLQHYWFKVYHGLSSRKQEEKGLSEFSYKKIQEQINEGRESFKLLYPFFRDIELALKKDDKFEDVFPNLNKLLLIILSIEQLEDLFRQAEISEEEQKRILKTREMLMKNNGD